MPLEWVIQASFSLENRAKLARLFPPGDNFDSRKRLSAMAALILWIVYGQGSPFMPLEWVIHASFSLEIQRRHKTSHKIGQSSLAYLHHGAILTAGNGFKP